MTTDQKDRVDSLLSDRRKKMDQSWVHSVENAKRIGRMNDLLMRAVHKAIRLGEKTARSLQWMERVSHQYYYDMEVYVHPEWQNSQSDLRYKRKYPSAKEEEERLIDEEDNISHTHLWNIIAEMGSGYPHHGVVACFEQMAYTGSHWDELDMVGEDGRTWDECLHFPAYQDQYFLMPFHHLYCDFFQYSFEDLCNINDFRVHVEIHLVTKEQDKTYNE